MLRTSRFVAGASGIGVAVLWAVVALGSPGGRLAAVSGPPFWLAWAIFTALALVATATALRGSPVVALLAGLVSLFPVGLYLLVLPGVFRWIGVLDALLVLSAGVALRCATREGGAEIPPQAPD